MSNTTQTNNLSLHLLEPYDGYQPSLASVRTWTEAACNILTLPLGDIGAVIVDAQTSQTYNTSYRGINKPTNVLSFPHHDIPTDHLSGDMVLCADIINEEAQHHHLSTEDYWAHVIIHGLCHIAGHDHQNDQDESDMMLLECQILEALHIPNPYEGAP